MIYTNKLGLPQSIVDSVTDYEPVTDRYGVTELLLSDKEIKLRRKYHNKIEVDVSDLIPALFGSAVHKVLEENTKEGQAEVKIEVEIENCVIAGKIDLLDGDDIIDYKTCSTSKITKQDFDNDYHQGMIYAWMIFKKFGIIKKNLKFWNLIKDYSKIKAIVQSPIYLWSYQIKDSDYDYIEGYIRRKLKSLASSEIKPCTDEERWYTGTQYAVYKNVSDKRASYVTDNEEDAHNYIRNKCGGAAEIKVRKGDYIKCKYYCSCNKFCDQRKEKEE